MKRLLGVLFLLFVSTSSFATTMQLLTLDQLTNASDIVVVGNIGTVTSGWQNSMTDMATVAQVKVTEYVKSGTSRPPTINLKHPGGKALGPFQKTWSMLVPGVPKFETGQKAMLFCKKNGNYWELVSWAQGYFRVQTTSTGQQIVTRDFEGVDFANDVIERVPDQMTLNHLVNLVRRMAK